jgi:hypothetical protein
MRVLHYDVWLSVTGLGVMIARVWGHPRNPNYDSWSVETIGM